MAKKRQRFHSPPPTAPISTARDTSLAFRLNLGFFFRQLCIFVVLDLLVYGWWFPQIALLKLSPGQALRNAFLMIFIATKENVLLLVLSGLTIILNTLLWPVSLIPIAIFAPALFVLLTADIVNPVLDKRIIGPAAEAEAADQQA